MKIAVFGSIELTVSCLEKLKTLDIIPTLVVATQEEFSISYSQNQKGTLVNARHVNVRQWAEQHNVACITFEDNKKLVNDLEPYDLDLALVVGWYHFIPQSIRQMFAHGCFGVHASLLPQLRGNAPLPRAILQRLDQTGTTLFEITDGIDEGDIIAQKAVPLDPRETIKTLMDKTSTATLDILETAFDFYKKEGRFDKKPQVGTPSYSLSRIPEDGCIDWLKSADDIDCLIRAVTRPYPGAYSTVNEEKIMIWESMPCHGIEVYGVPGQIFVSPDSRKDVYVVTNSGLLQILDTTDNSGEDCMPILRKLNNQRFG